MIRYVFLMLVVRSAQSATTVMIMRHCARSTDDAEVATTPELPFRFDNNYSAQAWPVFPVPPMYCLPRGADIVEGEGKWMREHGNLPQPIRVQCDEMERDVETGMRFMKGLQAEINHTTFVLDETPFVGRQMHAPKCMESFKQPPGYNAAMATALKENPMPESERIQTISRLHEIMGHGVGGDWTKAPCVVNNSIYSVTGSCAVAGAWSERLLMMWAGGMEVGWGGMQPEFELAKLHHIEQYWFYALNNPYFAARAQAAMPRAILSELLDGKEGTKIFVGHDSDLATLSSIFGLRWDAAPFAVNATLPASILRFDLNRGDASVQATYSFVPSYTNSSGNLRTVPADFGRGTGNKASLTTLQALVKKNTISDCAGLTKSDSVTEVIV